MRPLVAIALLLCASPAFAQIEECASFRRFIDDIVAGSDRTVDIVDVGQTARCVAVYAAGLERMERSAFREFVRRLESSRSDKQTGAGAGGAGSASVVAQGPVARILSLAVEHGALTQSVSDQTITLRGNLAGLPAALVRKNVFPYCIGEERLNGFCVSGSALSILRRVSFSVSLDPTRNANLTATPAGGDGGSQPVTFTGSSREVAAASVRVELLNQRDVTSPAFLAAWREQVGPALEVAAADLLAAAGDFVDLVKAAPEHEQWRVAALARVRAAGRDRAQLVAALQESLEALLPVVRAAVPDFEQRAAAALGAYHRFFLAQDELIERLALQNVLAIEYVNDRPAGQATTSRVQGVLDLPLTTRTKVVANGAFTLYNSRPAAAGDEVSRFRDARLGVQLDHGIGSVSILGPATVSVALYYQYQHAPALLDVDPANPVPNVTFVGLPAGAASVFAKTGDIWLAQAKLTLTPPDSRAKVPVSITYSNRTELIDKPTWGAQVGVSYDFDTIFSTLTSALR